MADLFAAVETFLAGIMQILNVFLLPIDPATGAIDWTLLPGEPLKLVVWFALTFAFVPLVYSFLLRAIQSARGGYAAAGEDHDGFVFADDLYDEEKDPDWLAWEKHGDREAYARFEERQTQRALRLRPFGSEGTHRYDDDWIAWERDGDTESRDRFFKKNERKLEQLRSYHLKD
jgi:hypothetical protein